jgi:hypothetical protein
LEIDDISDMWVFHKNTAFKPFVEEFMRRRIESSSEAEKMFFKIVLNSAYGYDIMNEEHYNKSKILDSDDTFIKQLAQTL